MITENDINWTGDEVIRSGANEGVAWKDLHRNSLDWYAENEKSPATWKEKALLEVSRRDREGEF